MQAFRVAVTAAPSNACRSGMDATFCGPGLHAGEPPKEYILRVLVDVDRSPAELVTVYRTSKASKYWQEGV
ncbi:MAG TPA: hypothetical protein VMW56_00255 [Candidatus Margulisiibacteriota bacterium]|nr:hypothetical protein [Candidatus Margulisiibacteriota bacterium]